MKKCILDLRPVYIYSMPILSWETFYSFYKRERFHINFWHVLQFSNISIAEFEGKASGKKKIWIGLVFPQVFIPLTTTDQLAGLWTFKGGICSITSPRQYSSTNSLGNFQSWLLIDRLPSKTDNFSKIWLFSISTGIPSLPCLIHSCTSRREELLGEVLR